MKNMRKIATLLLALALVLSLAAPVFADEATYSITIPETDTHTYEVYQIFTGDYKDEGRVLSNIVWGVNGTGTTDTAVDQTILDELTGAAETEVLNVVSKYVDLTTDPHTTVAGGASVAVEPGYYLLKDADGSLDGKDDAYTTFIVLVVDDVTVTRKAAKPSVDKQVWDEEADAEEGHEDGWNETADHELNESFQFKLIATITPDSDYAAYETYKLVFHDTMSKGITYESIESVTVNGEELDADEYVLSDNLVEGLAGEASWTLTIQNLLKHDADLTDGCEVVVIYNAHLNEDAVIGNIDDNKNTVHLEYSNNPNWDATFGSDGKDNDGDGEVDEDDEKDEPTGETPKDTVWVFTYEVKVNKVDGKDPTKTLAGAEFQMKNADGKWLVVDENGKVQAWVDNQKDASTLTSDENGLFTVIGLDHGTYTLVETKAPEGYNLLDEEITVEVEAVHVENADEISAETVFTINDLTEITVKNNAGATLPETGGMGTTLFYLVGGIMVLGAAVLLVTRKRMSTAG